MKIIWIFGIHMTLELNVIYSKYLDLIICVITNNWMKFKLKWVFDNIPRRGEMRSLINKRLQNSTNKNEKQFEWNFLLYSF